MTGTLWLVLVVLEAYARRWEDAADSLWYADAIVVDFGPAPVVTETIVTELEGLRSDLAEVLAEATA